MCDTKLICNERKRWAKIRVVITTSKKQNKIKQ